MFTKRLETKFSCFFVFFVVACGCHVKKSEDYIDFRRFFCKYRTNGNGLSGLLGYFCFNFVIFQWNFYFQLSSWSFFFAPQGTGNSCYQWPPLLQKNKNSTDILQNSIFVFSNLLFIILVPIICIESTNTRLRINGCALSSQRIPLHAPLFPYQKSSINKGIRAQREQLYGY
jgi:hypothetical protein